MAPTNCLWRPCFHLLFILLSLVKMFISEQTKMILELDDHNKDKDKDKERKEEGTRRKKNLFNFSHTSPLLSIRKHFFWISGCQKHVFSKIVSDCWKAEQLSISNSQHTFLLRKLFPSFFLFQQNSLSQAIIHFPAWFDANSILLFFFSPYSSHSHNLWNYVSVFILIARHWTSWNTV